MPFRRAGRTGYYSWIKGCDGRRKRMALGTADERTAERIEQWLEAERERGDPEGAVAAILDGTLTAMHAYSAGCRLPAVLADLRRKEADPDLRDHLDDFEREWRDDGRCTVVDSRRRIELLFEHGPIRPSDLQPVPLRTRILARPRLTGPTRNRYRSAVSTFCKYLVLHGHLPRNPVRDLPPWSEHRSPMRIFTPEEARQIIEAIPQPYRAAHALMAGAGWEWSAVARCRARDLNLTTLEAFARGTKNPWRTRMTRIMVRWAVPILADVLPADPDALVFRATSRRWSLALLKKTLETLGMGKATQHDWRHSHAVWLLERGELPNTVAHQLGHRDAHLVWTRYGRYVTSARHYRTVPADIAGASAG